MLNFHLIGGPALGTVFLLEVTWCLGKVKSKNVFARLSAESEYRVMAHTSELVWLRHMLEELGFKQLQACSPWV